MGCNGVFGRACRTCYRTSVGQAVLGTTAITSPVWLCANTCSLQPQTAQYCQPCLHMSATVHICWPSGQDSSVCDCAVDPVLVTEYVSKLSYCF